MMKFKTKLHQLHSEGYDSNPGGTMTIRHGWMRGGRTGGQTAVCSDALHYHLKKNDPHHPEGSVATHCSRITVLCFRQQ